MGASTISGASSVFNNAGGDNKMKGYVLNDFWIQVFNSWNRWKSRITLDTLRPIHIFMGIQQQQPPSSRSSNNNHVPSLLKKGSYSLPPYNNNNMNASTVDARNNNNKRRQDKQQEMNDFMSVIQERWILNGTYFFTNYVVVSMGVALVIALLHPGMIIVCLLLWSLWWGQDFCVRHAAFTSMLVVNNNNNSSNNNNMMMSNHENNSTGMSQLFINVVLKPILSIPAQHRQMILTFVTVLVVIWKCLLPFVSFVCVSGFIIAAHASFRDPQSVEACMEATTEQQSMEIGGINKKKKKKKKTNNRVEYSEADILVEDLEGDGDVI